MSTEQQQPETPVVVLHTGAETPAEAIERVLTFKAKVHQKGLTYKNKQGETLYADPNNNDCFVQLTMEIKVKDDSVMNIAKIAGTLANRAYDWMNRCKGIVKKAGFLIDVEQTYTENGENRSDLMATTSRVMLSQTSDVASYVARTLLLLNDGDNSEALLTGNFSVNAAGKLLMNRMGFSDAAAALPYKSKADLMDYKRKDVKKHIRSTMKEQLIEAGLYK